MTTQPPAHTDTERMDFLEASKVSVIGGGGGDDGWTLAAPLPDVDGTIRAAIDVAIEEAKAVTKEEDKP